jgi:hypothetical protein
MAPKQTGQFHNHANLLKFTITSISMPSAKSLHWQKRNLNKVKAILAIVLIK